MHAPGSGQSRGFNPTSTTTRSRPRSSLTAAIVVRARSSTCSSTSAQKWATSSIAGLGLLGCARPRAHARGRRRRLGRCSAAPTSSTTSRSCSRPVPRQRLRRRAAVDQLHRRGRLLRGRVLHAAALVAPRHGRDGSSARDLDLASSSRSSCCRSPPTCSPAGASATSRATRRREVLPARRVRIGRDALRHVAALRRHRLDPALDDRRASSTGHRPPLRSSRWRSCS